MKRMTYRKAGRSSWPLILFFALLAVLLPEPAFAVQIHGAPEGLYVHMMAHVFFTAAMVYLLYILRKRPPGQGAGWTFFRYSIYFFLLWNIDTFVVHWLSIRLPDQALAEAGSLWKHRLLLPLTLERRIYYIGRFDHVLCLPAIIFLVLSLRAFCRQAEQSRTETES